MLRLRSIALLCAVLTLLSLFSCDRQEPPISVESTSAQTEAPIETESETEKETEPPETVHVHTVVKEDAIEPGEHTEGRTESETCSECKEIIKESELLAPLHKIRTEQEAVAPTCAREGVTALIFCEDCQKVVMDQELIDKLEHTYDNGKCTACGMKEIDYTDVSIYASSYGYEYLGTQENGIRLQSFYRDIDTEIKKFHNDSSLTTKTYGDMKYCVCIVNYSKRGLNFYEGMRVANYYFKDHPLYYWASSNFWYNKDAGLIYIETSDLYANGRIRTQLNNKVYKYVEKCVERTRGMTSAYEIALAYHDIIVSECEYYEKNKSPNQDFLSAHSILGAVRYNSFVCEGYAKLFKLLLNVSNIENIYISGYGQGNAHAWNLVKLDDGNWYWCDLTWDDSSYLEHYNYQFFCVNDTERKSWNGFREFKATLSFADEHKMNPQYNETYYQRELYTVPDRSPVSFDHDGITMLYDTFEVNGSTYARTGAYEVQLFDAREATQLIIPKYVVYENVVYTVVALGNEKNFITSYADEASIPSTVVYTSPSAFHSRVKITTRDT